MKLFTLFISSVVMVVAISQNVYSKKKIDDWDYNQTKQFQDRSLIKSTNTKMIAPNPMPMPIPMPKMSRTLGFSVGGAKDADNFFENIKNGYLPKIDSITYEGIFYNYYFDIGKNGKCNSLFCPTYSTAIRKNLFTNKDEYFLTVGLDSKLSVKDFKRKKLNLVIVLDISGSMGSSFDRYYYNKGKRVENQKDSKKSKMQIANETIVNMMKHLKDEDRFGVVLFDNRAYRAKPLRKVKYTDMEAIKRHILELKERGGTNWSAGYKEGLKLFDNIPKNKEYENRIIFITDAMPNLGELRKDRLFGMIKDASKKKIYTSVIGVGIDFNNDLVEYISKTRGANYFSIHSSKEFKKRLDKEFDYLVTPLVFDLKLRLKAKAYKIDAVYGAPKANKATGEILTIDTLFPSDSKEGRVKGGVVLVKLKKIKNYNDTIKLKVSYKDRDGKSYQNYKVVRFKRGIYYDNSGIKKAIALSDFVNIMKNWLIDARTNCNDKVNFPPISILKKRCLYPPYLPNHFKTWERKSCPLRVSEGYKKLFSIFLRHFDPKLKREYQTLKLLINQPSNDILKKDDWNFIQ